MVIRLLVTDDHALARMGVRVLLESARDIEIVGEASSGQEALALATSLQPDVALMDVKMSDGDGIEAARTIRGRCPKTKVLILSAYGDSALLRRAANAGAAGYLLKDISSADLARAIIAVHQGTTALAPGIAKHLMDQLTEAGSLAESARRGPHGLTERETEVLIDVAQGLSDKEIAAKLFLSESTVKTHLRAVYRRLRLRNRAHAAAFTIARNLDDGHFTSSASKTDRIPTGAAAHQVDGPKARAADLPRSNG